jgi:hypothetical protein
VVLAVLLPANASFLWRSFEMNPPLNHPDKSPWEVDNFKPMAKAPVVNKSSIRCHDMLDHESDVLLGIAKMTSPLHWCQ